MKKKQELYPELKLINAKNQSVSGWQYLKVEKSRIEYKGLRYFRFSMNDNNVLQICLSPGDIRRGRGNNIGMTMVCRLNFFANYMAMGYAIPCEKKEFDFAFKTCLKLLNP